MATGNLSPSRVVQVWRIIRWSRISGKCSATKRRKKIWSLSEDCSGGGIVSCIYVSREERWMKLRNLLLCRKCIVAGCYSIPDDQDQIRFYPRESRLSNAFMTCKPVSSQILLIDSLWNKLIVFCADGKLNMYTMNIVKEDPASGRYFYVRLSLPFLLYFFCYYSGFGNFWKYRTRCLRYTVNWSSNVIHQWKSSKSLISIVDHHYRPWWIDINIINHPSRNQSQIPCTSPSLGPNQIKVKNRIKIEARVKVQLQVQVEVKFQVPVKIRVQVWFQLSNLINWICCFRKVVFRRVFISNRNRSPSQNPSLTSSSQVLNSTQIKGQNRFVKVHVKYRVKLLKGKSTLEPASESESNESQNPNKIKAKFKFTFKTKSKSEFE
jgi:hypothetical protein